MSDDWLETYRNLKSLISLFHEFISVFYPFNIERSSINEPCEGINSIHSDMFKGEIMIVSNKPISIPLSGSLDKIYENLPSIMKVFKKLIRQKMNELKEIEENRKRLDNDLAPHYLAREMRK